MPMRYGEKVLAQRGGLVRAAKEQGRDYPAIVAQRSCNKDP
jgi:hypothetical protein